MALVRPYEDRDHDACVRLWVQLTEWHREIYADDSIGGDDLTLWFDRYLAEQKPLHVWVAEVDGRVVGFTGAHDQDQRWELEPIVVDRAFRTGGVGSALVAALVDAARAAGKRGVIVHPAARNVGALRFFHGHGFDVLGQIELVLDLARPERWREGERLAGREFRV